MSRQTLQTAQGAATLRPLTESDVGTAHQLAAEWGPAASEWSPEQWSAQLRSFPEGQVALELAGRWVALSSSLIVHLGRDDYRPHTRAGITDGGTFYNHDLGGDTLYWVQLGVASDVNSSDPQRALAAWHQQRCKELGLRRVLTPVAVAHRLSGATGERPGPNSETCTTTLEQLGFAVCGRLDRYYPGGEPALLLEWLNPEYRAPGLQSDNVRVALVQYRTGAIDSFDQFASRVEYFVEAARGYHADFVVFPEFTTMQLLSSAGLHGTPSAEGIERLAALTPRVFGLFARLAQQYGLYIVGGTQPVRQASLGDTQLHNVCPIATPQGRVLMQPKLHMTPWETEVWGLRGGHHLAVIDTPKARVGVLICYDSEFPEAARYLADQGIDVLFVPYCTDDRQGYLRVRWCCQARAVENQIFVAATGLVGNLAGVAGLDVHYGQAAVLTPSDFGFARDGVQAEADGNVETLLVADLDVARLHRARFSGSVRPRLDRRSDLFRTSTTFAGTLPEYHVGC